MKPELLKLFGHYRFSVCLCLLLVFFSLPVSPSVQATSGKSFVQPHSGASTSVSGQITPGDPSPSVAQPTILENFEGPSSGWKTTLVTAGTGASVNQTSTQVAAGSYAARAATVANNQQAQLQVNFSEDAATHTWGERPGTWYWQGTSLYIPGSTLNQLTGPDYFTLAGLWPSQGGAFGWYLRVHQGGAIYVFGYTRDGNPVEFPAYATFPTDRWVNLELGLHSQSGPGVKRAFSFVIDGNVYGWYNQGHMVTENYDRVGFGILSSSANKPLEVFVDQWQNSGTGRFPNGPDNRPTNSPQEQDFRNQSGVQVQYDWSTWEYGLTLDATHGLYSKQYRFQAGRNLDRMPDLTSGWAEIEIDWSQGQPTNLAPTADQGALPMMAFRKEINREENIEIVPVGAGNGKVNLVLDAWVGSAVILASWPLPVASIGGTSIPEPGDIIRVRWEQKTATVINIRASYYDASANQWYYDVISGDFDLSAVSDGSNTVNYSDGYHTAAAITADTPEFSIRRFKVGTLDSYPCGNMCTPPDCSKAIVTSNGDDGGPGTLRYAIINAGTCAVILQITGVITLGGPLILPVGATINGSCTDRVILRVNSANYLETGGNNNLKGVIFQSSAGSNGVKIANYQNEFSCSTFKFG
jgi:hypothetical protein